MNKQYAFLGVRCQESSIYAVIKYFIGGIEL